FTPTGALSKRRASHMTAFCTKRPSALRYADPMVQAIWNALLVFDLLPTGFSNRDLRNNLAALRGQPVDQFTQGRMTYQLRRLRLQGLIERIPKTHRCRPTNFGFRVAVFCTRTSARILRSCCFCRPP